MLRAGSRATGEVPKDVIDAHVEGTEGDGKMWVVVLRKIEEDEIGDRSAVERQK